MDVTPKLNRRNTLSLRRSRHSNNQGSPRNGLLSKLHASDALPKEPPGSPTVMKLASLNKQIEYTPPNKKMHLNLDYSPKLFDANCSPSELLSQTMAVDSPEVGWSWNHNKKQANAKVNVASSTAISGESLKRKTQQTDSQHNTRMAYQLRREARDTQIVSEKRRAEKDRADDVLKKRCAKLRAQLGISNTKSAETKPEDLPRTRSYSITSTPNAERLVSAEEFDKPDKGNEFDDFFNDSEDDFLLEATQSLEAKIVEMTQKTPTNPVKSSSKPEESTFSANVNENKRSSLYMKFLEDDSIDDWFESLDDILQQSAQDKKPRSPFQRYKSMPAQTTSDTARAVTRATTNTNTAKSSVTNAAGPSDTRTIKRHSSTHAISPHSSNCRGHQLHHLRK